MDILKTFIFAALVLVMVLFVTEATVVRDNFIRLKQGDKIMGNAEADFKAKSYQECALR